MALTTVDAGLLSSQSQQTWRNRIINGAMVIDQRNAGAAVTADGAFPVDRFQLRNSSDGTVSGQQISDAPSGFINSFKWTTTAADASLSAAQYTAVYTTIEGLNITDFAWGTASAATVTLSFWVKSSITGTFSGALANSAYDRSYPFNYTISVASTWEYKTITIAGDTSGTWLTTNGLGIRLYMSLGAGSNFTGTANAWGATGRTASTTGTASVIGTLNATWQFTGVQLEKGSTATSFDYRPYGLEYLLCQRYFQYLMLFGGNSSGALSIVRASSSAGASESNMNFQGPIMRTNPTVTAVAGSSNILYASSFGSSGSSFTYTITATPNSPFTGLVLRFRGGPSLNDGTAYVLWNNGGDLYAKLDAEL
jgi:hypothetical protein